MCCRGATQFLQIVDLLVAEFWPYGLARAGMGITEFLDIIRGFQYGALLLLTQWNAPNYRPTPAYCRSRA